MNVYAGWWTGRRYINLTAAEEILPEYVDRMTPRMNSLLADSWALSDCPKLDAANVMADSSALYLGTDNSNGNCEFDKVKDCVKKICGNSDPTSLRLSLIDTKREKVADIGRGWDYPPIPMDSIYLHENMARLLDLHVGDTMIIVIPTAMINGIVGLAKELLNDLKIDEDLPSNVYDVAIPVKIAVILSTSDSVSKIGNTHRNSAFMEFDTLIEYVARHCHPKLPTIYREYLQEKGMTLRQYATDIFFSCGIPRTSCFSNSDYNIITEDMLKWQTDVVYRLGYNQLEINTPIIKQLKRSNFFSAFLNLLLSIVLILLGSITIFLVYSLLVVAVETRTFEFGIFRMVGMTRTGLVSVVLTQAMFYAIPAWIAGLLFSQITMVILTRILYDFTRVTVSPLLTAQSVIFGSLLGLLCPCVSSIYPIRMALSKNLRDSLDTRRAKAKAVEITIERSSSGSTFRLPLISMGIMLVTFGVCLYYLLPLSLIRGNITLLFNIFLLVLIGLLFGLVTLTFNFQPILEWIIGSAIFQVFLRLIENRSLAPIVMKNLVLHRVRNRKTALIYAMALAFILFLNVSIRIQLTSIIYQKKQTQGSDIAFNRADYPKTIPNMKKINQYLKSVPDLVESFTYMSYNIDLGLQYLNLQNYGKLLELPLRPYSVMPNFFEVANSNDFLIVDQDDSLVRLQKDNEGYKRLGQALYSASGGMYLSASLKESLVMEIPKTEKGLTERLPFLINSAFDSSNKPLLSPRYPLAFLRQCPILLAMSLNPSSFTDAVISLTDAVELSDERFTSVTQVPMERLFIKTKPGVTELQINKVLSEVNQISENTAKYTTAEAAIQGLKSASDLLTIIFQGITLMTMIVSFFSLNSTMYTNILEQRQEMGVWRSLGVNKVTVYRIFAYEAFILTSSSSILGMLVGSAMGITMAAQRAILTQTPIYFEFPTILVLQVIGTSFACAILATVGPVSALMKKPIIGLLK